MCTRVECIEKLTKAEPYIRKEFGVSSMCLFGSMARVDNRPDSDVDIFVEMPPKMFKIIGLKNYLQDILGLAVDVIRKHPGLNSFLLNEINRDGITIFS